MLSERIDIVDGYLRTIGCAPTRFNDPTALWHSQFQYPANQPHVMHVICPKANPEAVIILSRTMVAPEHLQAFQVLDSDAKEEFLWDLRRILNVVDADFQLEGAQSPTDCPTSIQTSAIRYFDGLNLDSFARSVGAVFKTELNGMWVIHRHLGPKGFAPGDRFDFKRLGL